jgi:hypothetical protein
VTNIISPNDQVFIGEEGLNITAAVPEDVNQIAWFSPGSNPQVDVPSLILTIGSKQNFYVSPTQFGHATGTWYTWNATALSPAFQVFYPTLNMRLWNQDTGQDVSGMSVNPGTLVNFRVETNMISITRRAGYDPGSDGYISLLLTSPSGATLTAVIGPDGTPIPLQNFDVDTLPWYLIPPGTDAGWDTAAFLQAGSRLYPTGTYTARMDYNVNRLQDNLQGVAGISRPFPVQITIASERVAIASNVPEVIRGNPFTVTISGLPGADYYLWVRNTGGMTGNPGSQPPLISLNQEGVRMDPEEGPYTIGSYPISTRRGMTIRDDVPPAPANGTRYYALVTLPGTGTRTVQWQTASATDDRRYAFQIERTSAGMVSSGEVSVGIVRGSVSIVTGPTRSFYLGEQVVLSGTNTESDTVYLFMTGPNLPSSGGSLANPRISVITGQPGTFTAVQVDSDNTWEYRWLTGNLGIDAGAYTVYVVSGPNSRNDLGERRFSTVSVSFARPFVTAASPRTVVARGDPVEIRGTATGNPSPGVAIWIFGVNRFLYSVEGVNSDSSFSYTLSEGQTDALAVGQYYMVIQHPGYTNNLDVYPDPSHQLVLSIYPVPGSALFRIGGAGALMSSQAANALIRALSSPFIDDTYMVMSFSLVNPQITINSSATHTLGERINLSGTTNLAPGNRLLVEVTSQTFGPTPKDQSGAFSGITDTVTVQDGPGDQNTWSFSFDTTSFIPDTYVVRVSGITVSNAVASTSFTLNPVTPTPTPTPPPTTRPTTPPTTEPTPVPTTTAGLTPITIIGAIAVFLVAFGIVRGRS